MKTSTGNQTAAIITMALTVVFPIVVTIIDVLATPGVINNESNFLEWHNSEGNCTGPDLIITSVASTNTGSGKIKYTVSIKNVGNATAVMDYSRIAGWQAYLSTNGVAKDLRVNGKNFGGTLDIGKTTSASAVVPADLTTNRHYLIVELYVLSSVGECDSSNNTFVFKSPQQ